MNQNSIIDFANRYNKCEVTLYCRKCDPDFAGQDKYKLIPEELLLLIITDSYLYVK